MRYRHHSRPCYKDYRDGKTKALSLTAHQFVQRFVLHVLPKRFAKIRHYGILSNRSRSMVIPAILYFFERRVRCPKQFSLVDHLKKVFNRGFGYMSSLEARSNDPPYDFYHANAHSRWSDLCLKQASANDLKFHNCLLTHWLSMRGGVPWQIQGRTLKMTTIMQS